jgi:hypothetical protein
MSDVQVTRTRMDAEQRGLLATTLREVLGGPAADVDAVLDGLGWQEVVADDPATATTLLFTEHGRALATTALLDRVVLDALHPDLPGPAALVCHAALGSGSATSSTPTRTDGILLRRPEPGDQVLVPTTVDGVPHVGVVAAEQLTATALRTFDPSLSWWAVAGPPPAATAPAPSWPAALAAGRRALAAELVGLAGEVLRLAVEHTSTRQQFGAPIAAFQAVRHRLADAHVAVTAAGTLLDAAFDDGTPVSAGAAKAHAGRAHDVASANALQVCGAMGSSLEHPLHRFVARGVVLDALLGSSADLRRELGALVRTTGQTPRLVEV